VNSSFTGQQSGHTGTFDLKHHFPDLLTLVEPLMENFHIVVLLFGPALIDGCQAMYRVFLVQVAPLYATQEHIGSGPARHITASPLELQESQIPREAIDPFLKPSLRAAFDAFSRRRRLFCPIPQLQQPIREGFDLLIEVLDPPHLLKDLSSNRRVVEEVAGLGTLLLYPPSLAHPVVLELIGHMTEPLPELIELHPRIDGGAGMGGIAAVPGRRCPGLFCADHAHQGAVFSSVEAEDGAFLVDGRAQELPCERKQDELLELALERTGPKAGADAFPHQKVDQALIEVGDHLAADQTPPVERPVQLSLGDLAHGLRAKRAEYHRAADAVDELRLEEALHLRQNFGP